MNACGQHNMSAIGFQGMSINAGKLVAPALKYFWWWNLGNGSGRFSDKVIKTSRRGPDALRYILNDFEANANGNHFRLLYYTRRKVFLRILKPLADTTNLVDADFIDWEMLIKKLLRRMCGSCN
jgi:sulfite reductase (ferredoxin)